jgi:hypothetical protein
VSPLLLLLLLLLLPSFPYLFVPLFPNELIREILMMRRHRYFCREYIEGYFLNSPSHSRFIDAEVLERYYPVGGIRIEDDILVTEGGYENLTTAPKGEELMSVINGEEGE